MSGIGRYRLLLVSCLCLKWGKRISLYVTFPASSVSPLLGMSCIQEQFLFRGCVLLKFLMEQKWVEMGFFGLFVFLFFFLFGNGDFF